MKNDIKELSKEQMRQLMTRPQDYIQLYLDQGTNNNIKAGILFTVQKIIKRFTTKTWGWILTTLEEDRNGPNEQFVRFLIIKA